MELPLAWVKTVAQWQEIQALEPGQTGVKSPPHHLLPVLPGKRLHVFESQVAHLSLGWEESLSQEGEMGGRSVAEPRHGA